MMENYINEKKIGTFAINGNDYLGELKLSGEDSLLTVWGDSRATSILGHNLPGQIHCLFSDLQRATLIGLANFGGGSHSKKRPDGDYETRHYSDIYPNYVLFGDRYIDKEECTFEALEFVTSHSTTLFHDYSSFQDIMHTNKEMVEQLTTEDSFKSNELYGHSSSERDIKIGDHPIISIYTGYHELCVFDTSIGRIEIKNIPSHQLASSNGYSIENKVSCTIRFSRQLNFEQANKKLAPLLSFFELIMGRRLQVLEYKLHAPSSKEYPDTFEIYQCRNITIEEGEKTPLPAQRLIHVESNSSEFETVVKNWLARQNEWQDARWQFFGSFTENQYDTDRLIKVANMFDIIPDSAYGGKVELTTELQTAKTNCRKIFKELPESIERNSILGALGRLGTKSLKHKIQTRVAIIKSAISVDLPDIEFITEHSVDCRNHFVHGGKRKFDYYDNFDMVCFFINTLEFIYGLSELIESGWDFDNWKSNSPMNHPFVWYIENYQINLRKLQSVTKSRFNAIFSSKYS